MNKFLIALTLITLTNTSFAETLKVTQVKAPNTKMSFLSSDIAHNSTLTNAQVANGFGCQGQNISPELHWANAPAGTKSYAITAYDPDAPTGSGFWHWAVFNIPADANKLERNVAQTPEKLPHAATQSYNSTGEANFIGACPPMGDKAHRYIFTIYALNTTLELTAKTTPEILGFTLNGKVLAKSQLIGYYKR